ncbi:hypothetical protein L226DRAFT_20981 [Lentinus tigrinus ALCF2SS1-7]|uniref:uncharacterized protein n=1 Tax=Lentinus tigrinus ALCF2SS1-7 TaxID=1328758 RepID=UPI0011660692|nr:hypothetical protein L226DRAFT_20981 [Lentinus tigrinus ALCF2SS1-7]
MLVKHGRGRRHIAGVVTQETAESTSLRGGAGQRRMGGARRLDAVDEFRRRWARPRVRDISGRRRRVCAGDRGWELGHLKELRELASEQVRTVVEQDAREDECR